MKDTTAKLLISDSERNADMLYVSGLFVPDPFVVTIIESDLDVPNATRGRLLSGSSPYSLARIRHALR